MIPSSDYPIRRRGRCAMSARPAGHSRAAALAERLRRQDALLDEALEETFPASDPVSVMLIT